MKLDMPVEGEKEQEMVLVWAHRAGGGENTSSPA